MDVESQMNIDTSFAGSEARYPTPEATTSGLGDYGSKSTMVSSQDILKLRCSECNFYFNSHAAFKSHLLMHKSLRKDLKHGVPQSHRKEQFYKIKRGKNQQSDQPVYMKNQVAGSVKLVLTCEFCSKLFHDIDTLKDHVRGKHNVGQGYHCLCGKEFRWRATFVKHRKTCPDFLSGAQYY